MAVGYANKYRSSTDNFSVKGVILAEDYLVMEDILYWALDWRPLQAVWLTEFLTQFRFEPTAKMLASVSN